MFQKLETSQVVAWCVWRDGEAQMQDSSSDTITISDSYLFTVDCATLLYTADIKCDRKFTQLPLYLSYKMTINITIDHILQAAERIKVHRTPVQSSAAISALASVDDHPVEVFFKCELLQKTGCK